MTERRSTLGTPAGPAVTKTVRERMADALRASELTARELSQRAAVSEREIAGHLDHLSRSLAHADERLIVEAPHCISCGFSFHERDRLKRPSRCPRCKSERISPARFAIRSTA